jgi:hypothetical protein
LVVSFEQLICLHLLVFVSNWRPCDLLDAHDCVAR